MINPMLMISSVGISIGKSSWILRNKSMKHAGSFLIPGKRTNHVPGDESKWGSQENH